MALINALFKGLGLRVKPVLFLQKSTNLLRLCSSNSSDKTSSNKSNITSSISNDDFQPIYKFPHIVFVRLICRAKLYQTAITVASIPIAGALYYHQLVPLETFYSTLGIGVFASVMLYVVSELTRRAVGIIYVDRQATNLRIAYLTFWGNRRDVVVPVDDVIPLADCSENARDLFVKLRRYSTDHELYFSIRFGLILDKDAFENVFGSIDETMKNK